MEYLGTGHVEGHGWKYPMHIVLVRELGEFFYQSIEGNCVAAAKEYAVSAEELEKAIEEQRIELRGEFIHIV